MTADSLSERQRRQILGFLALLTVITIIITINSGGHDAQQADNATEGNNVDPGEYPCPQCGSVYHSEFDRAFHLKWVHGFWA